MILESPANNGGVFSCSFNGRKIIVGVHDFNVPKLNIPEGALMQDTSCNCRNICFCLSRNLYDFGWIGM